MKIGDVLETAKKIGRTGFDLSNNEDAVYFLNIALRRLAFDAKPMALLSNVSNIEDDPLVWLDDFYFIKTPQAIKVDDITNNAEIILDNTLFDALVYAVLTNLNTDNEYFAKQYAYYKNQYRESIFNDRLRRTR